MDNRSQTGTSNPEYNLISVLYHALQGAETYDQYAEDAQRDGDQDLARFFKDAQQQFAQCAERAKLLLASRLQGGVSTGAATGQAAAAMGHAGSKPGQVG